MAVSIAAAAAVIAASSAATNNANNAQAADWTATDTSALFLMLGILACVMIPLIAWLFSDEF